MGFKVSTSQANAQALEQQLDKLLGLPLKGTHVGGGLHVDMPDTWNGSGKVPPGWSSYLGSSFKHPTLSQWATLLDPNLAAALLDSGKTSKLSGAELAALQAAASSATATLTSDWFT